MAELRDFFGSKCLHCRADILQPLPSTNRMPTELAHCPSCHTRFSLADLTSQPSSGSLFKRLFQKPNRA